MHKRGADVERQISSLQLLLPPNKERGELLREHHLCFVPRQRQQWLSTEYNIRSKACLFGGLK